MNLTIAIIIILMAVIYRLLHGQTLIERVFTVLKVPILIILNIGDPTFLKLRQTSMLHNFQLFMKNLGFDKDSGEYNVTRKFITWNNAKGSYVELDLTKWELIIFIHHTDHYFAWNYAKEIETDFTVNTRIKFNWYMGRYLDYDELFGLDDDWTYMIYLCKNHLTLNVEESKTFVEEVKRKVIAFTIKDNLIQTPIKITTNYGESNLY